MDSITLSVKDLLALIGGVGVVGAIIGSLSVLSYRVNSIEKEIHGQPDGINPRLAILYEWMIRCKAQCPGFNGNRKSHEES